MAKAERNIEKWLKEEQSYIERFRDWFLCDLYNNVPMDFRWFGILNFVFKCLMVVSVPAIAYFVDKRYTLWQASLVAAVLLIAYCTTSMLDAWSKRKSGTADLAAQEIWERIGDLLTLVKPDSTLAVDRDRSIQACLGIIEGYARLVTRSAKGKIGVSLALYDGKGTSKMNIKHRNPGNLRPVNRGLKNLEIVLGHHACKAGREPRVVGDLKRFGKEVYVSPTSSKCVYRSMFLIPVISTKTGQIKGFLSVDCASPFAFNGSAPAKLVTTCEPMINHIQHQI